VGSLRFNWSRLELVCLPYRLFGWVALELEQTQMKWLDRIMAFLSDWADEVHERGEKK
jgi:hypothetical protein